MCTATRVHVYEKDNLSETIKCIQYTVYPEYTTEQGSASKVYKITF